MENEKRFVFFKGLYSTLDLYTQEMERICEKRGYTYFTLHAAEKSGKPILGEKEKFISFIQKPVTAAIGFGDMGLCFEDENKVSYWDKYHIPYINMMMDHPFHLGKAMEHAADNTILLCPDKNHVNYIRRFYKNIRMAEFLPHAGKETNVPKQLLLDRKIDVLYAGGLSRGVVENMIPDLKKFKDFDGEDLMETVLSNLVKHPATTTEAAIEQYLIQHGIFYSEVQLAQTIRELRFLDMYITSMFREMTIRLLVENGIKVTLYGTGWEVCDWIHHPNLDYEGIVPAQMVPILMQESKIVLNTMTWFKDGSHDRIFNGMLAKAVVVSDSSIYLKETLKDGEEIMFFELDHLKELPDQIHALLKDEEKLVALSEHGYRRAKQEHTWENRLDTILQTVLPAFEVH